MLYLLVLTFGLTISFCNSESETGQFWHVADLHVDDRYSTNGNPDFMCWEVSTEGSRAPGIFGDYLCDSPQVLIESAVDAMVQINPNPDFIVWTGDDTTHVNDSFFNIDIVFNVIKTTTDVIRTRFPNTSVVPVLGNHDWYPQNQVPPGESELQTRVADLWKDWLTEFDGYSEFAQNGRFLANIPGTNISILALNTLVWYEFNQVTKDDLTLDDPGAQFEWMNQVLGNISKQTEKKAYLVGHIPPGFFERYFKEREGFYWYQPRHNQKFIEIVQKFSPATIEAQFYAHHHTDSFRVFTDADGNPVSYGLIAPGVTPLTSSLSDSANNPGIRLITYNKRTGEVVDSSTYYLDLMKANKIGEAKWEHEYDLKEMLNIDRITPANLYQAAQSMKTDDALFSKFYSTNTVQWQNSSSCDSTCRLVLYCSTVEIDYDAYYGCNGVGSIFHSALIMITGFLVLMLPF